MALFKSFIQKSLTTLILLAIILTLVTSESYSEMPRAQALLQDLLLATKQLSYKGRVTIMIQTPMKNMVFELMITRKAPDKRRVEIISPLEMAGSGTIINGKEIAPIMPSKDRKEQGGPMPPFFQPDQMDELQSYNIQQLIRNYKIRVLEGGLVAGRNTYLIEIEPKNENRPARKIWIDKEKKIALKVEQYNAQKILQRLVAFSNIDFATDISDEVFRIQRSFWDMGRRPKPPEREDLWDQLQGKLDLNKIKEKAKFDVKVLNSLPGGLALQSITMVKFEKDQNVHLIYTDGLTFVSLFQSPFDETKRERRPPEGSPHREPPGERREGGHPPGAPSRPPKQPDKPEKMKISDIDCDVLQKGSAFIFRWYKQGVYFTLIGDYPKKEMVKMVSSIIK
ncbi:MAG: sigma-E factor regulatory protein RseB domain-containing protein [Candidatus Poribacteria bacterium]